MSLQITTAFGTTTRQALEPIGFGMFGVKSNWVNGEDKGTDIAGTHEEIDPDTGEVIEVASSVTAGTGHWEYELVSAAPQNFDTQGIAELVKKTLTNQPCVNFAQTILNGVSSKHNPALAGGSLAGIFEVFLNQTPKHDLYTRKPPEGSWGYGNPIGNIRKGTAMIFTVRATGEQTIADAVGVISELFHLAGEQGFYSDKELATALNKSEYAIAGNAMAGATGKPVVSPERNPFDPRYRPRPGDTEENQHAYSAYFHTIQGNICNAHPGTTRALW